MLPPQLLSGLALAGAAFVLGLVGGGMLAPGQHHVITAAAQAAPPPPDAARAPADVLRVIDGDTFEARVHVWPDIAITTKVRLRDIDAPELKARCQDERTKAEAAHEALQAMLAEGDVMVMRVGQDKYGGRVLAAAGTRTTPDVGAALLVRGLVRPYRGGRREPWCDNH